MREAPPAAAPAAAPPATTAAPVQATAPAAPAATPPPRTSRVRIVPRILTKDGAPPVATGPTAPAPPASAAATAPAQDESAIRDAIVQQINPHYDAIRDCYDNGVRERRKGDQIAVRFVVAPSGDVVSLSEESSSVPERPVVDCVLGVFRRMKFRPWDGKAVTVVHPMEFA